MVFSTDSNPEKSKTNGIIFGNNNHLPASLSLYNTQLPWCNKIKHLGILIDNTSQQLSHDVLSKRAIYINKNIELIREFHFCHPITVFKANYVFNTSFYGSQLWNLFSSSAELLYNSWNVSFRHMYKLPYRSHRYFIEPISGKPHIKFSLYKRFIKFCEMLKNSNKLIVKLIYNFCSYNTESVIGSNLCNIMLQCKLR